MSNQRADAGRTGITRVSFLCQKCSLPLRPDHSLSNISAAQYEELTAPFTSSSEREDLVKITQSRAGDIPDGDNQTEDHKFIPPAEMLPCDSGNDFTLLGVPSPHSGENLSQVMRVTTELFDILSGQSEVDHPLCEECTDALLDKLDHQLKITEDECKDYKSFLEKLTEAEDQIDVEAVNEELNQLKEDEIQLRQQLTEMEEEGQQLHQQLRSEKEHSEQLEQEEDKYFKEYNEYKRQLLEYEDAQRSVDNQLRYAKSQLDCLKKTNVFNATFHIWHRGHFGTINNFRLGRLPSVPVEWSEINAAWGQTVLLLHSLSNKMNLQFERYRLVPYGNHSFLESLKDKSKELPLYGSGGFRFFWDAKFDQAMVAFLDCLQQFKEEVEKGDPDFCLPYRMDKGRIEDTSTGTSYSVKIQFNSEEQWTKALKFMLTNLKWGLAWVSSQFANK